MMENNIKNSMDASSKAVSYNTLYITLSTITCLKSARFTCFLAFLKASSGIGLIFENMSLMIFAANLNSQCEYLTDLNSVPGTYF